MLALAAAAFYLPLFSHHWFETHESIWYPVRTIEYAHLWRLGVPWWAAALLLCLLVTHAAHLWPLLPLGPYIQFPWRLLITWLTAILVYPAMRLIRRRFDDAGLAAGVGGAAR